MAREEPEVVAVTPVARVAAVMVVTVVVLTAVERAAGDAKAAAKRAA